jgi:hypothetical protein
MTSSRIELTTFRLEAYRLNQNIKINMKTIYIEFDPYCNIMDGTRGLWPWKKYLN